MQPEVSQTSETEHVLGTATHSASPDTIYALSSGNPPAAIAIVRVSGPGADSAMMALAGRLPVRRLATRCMLRDSSGEALDHGLVFRFPGPNSATGEDLVEFHLHGGRSVIESVLTALGTLKGLRAAGPGEFTRRAFENGRIDLSEAEGLADLLLAETESQRRAALAVAGGAVSRKVEAWRGRILGLGAEVEALLDFGDEDDVGDTLRPSWGQGLDALAEELEAALALPSSERLRDGIRVVIAGPPNAGKSSLLNVLAGRDAAITSAVAGTTRDLVEAPCVIGGTAFLLIDTAGLRTGGDEIEAIGVERALRSVDVADLILWLGETDECPDPARAILVHSKSDVEAPKPGADVELSAVTGQGVVALVALMIARARTLLPVESEVAINLRHRLAIVEALSHLQEARVAVDPVLAAEDLRQARASLDRITGKAGVEDMLDALFGKFCIGK